MAPLAPTNTARYKVFYTTCGHDHTFQVRTVSVSPSALGTYVDNFLTAISAQLFSLVVTEVQFAGTGSDIFNSVTSGIEGNTYGGGGAPELGTAWYLDFIGRSSGGRRVRLAVFGTQALGGNYRYSAAEDSDVDAGIAVLNAATNTFMSIDGVKPIWKAYANAGVNAHWQKAIR